MTAAKPKEQTVEEVDLEAAAKEAADTAGFEVVREEAGPVYIIAAFDPARPPR